MTYEHSQEARQGQAQTAAASPTKAKPEPESQNADREDCRGADEGRRKRPDHGAGRPEAEAEPKL